MIEALNKKLERAIKKLTTLNEVTLKSTRSSHYSFGIVKPAINDRFNISIQLDVDSSVNCQIIFDSKYIDFPPDIVFLTLPDMRDISTLLPIDDWNLDREDCLYTWFERILKLLIKKPTIVKEVQPKLSKSFFDETPTKGKKRTYFDSDDEDEVLTDPLPKVKKLVLWDDDDMLMFSDNEIDTKKSTMEDDYDDFDMEITKPVVDYKSKYKDDYDDGDILFPDDTNMKFKHNEKGDHLTDEEYVSIKAETPFPSGSGRPQTKRFGSIRANLASFRKKSDIHTFPSKPAKGRVKQNFVVSDEDDRIIAPPMRGRMESPERQKYRPMITSPQSKKQEKRKLPLSQPQQPKMQTKLFDLGSIKEKQDDFRKTFMTAWLSKYKENIMVYDLRKYEYFSLLMTFRLSIMSDQWAEFKEFKAISIEDLEEKEGPKDAIITKPKPHAPIIISFKMDARSFPSSKLKIQLISVMNTSSPGSSEPDTESFEYQVNQKESVDETIESIMRSIKDKAPNFHLQMAKK